MNALLSYRTISPAISLIGLLLVQTVVPLEAQRVAGRVIEEGSERTVRFAQISLITNGAVAARTISDSAGFFLLDTPAGIHVVRAEALGYTTRFDTIRVADSEVLNIVIRLSARGIALAPLEVRARSGDEPGRYGFERRRALGRGVFLTDDSVRLRSPRTATDAFYGIPNVAVLEGWRAPLVYSWSGGKCLLIYLDNMLRPIETGRAPTGAQLRASSWVGQGRLNQFVDVDRIKGIEVYRSISEVPQELRNAMRMGDLWENRSPRQVEPCGLAWVWTDNGW